MAEECYVNSWVHFYISEVTSRVVAESGIASDRFHLGKIILQCLKDNPEFVLQIDGATGQSETNGSVLKRSIQCATSLRNMGLKKDDVIVLMAPNHLDLTIPFYAGWYLGLPVAPTDRTMSVYELKHSFGITKPKVVFCQSEKVQDVQKAVEDLGIDIKIISFDNSPDAISFLDMLQKYGGDADVSTFRATDFNTEETISLLIPTSGSTGLPKSAAMTHKNIAIAAPNVWAFSTKFPGPTRATLLIAPLQWLTTLLNFVINPIVKFLRVQTSANVTPQHIVELIKKYEPTFVATSPTLLVTLMKIADQAKCNDMFSCFELMYVGGSAVSPDILKQMKELSPSIIVQEVYGLSELGSLAFQCVGAPLGSCGKRQGHLQYRLIDVETKKDVKEPNKPGELWVKGPGVFKEYFNDPEMTKEAFAEDGWFMTGDMLYRDEAWNYYFVERIKLLLKYKSYQILISPVEIELVIRQHRGVLDVVVTGVPDPECGDLPVACVVLRPGFDVTEEEIKHLVKEKLSDSKQLRGGVIFLTELPLTASTKVHRRKIKDIVMERIDQLELIRD